MVRNNLNQYQASPEELAKYKDILGSWTISCFLVFWLQLIRSLITSLVIVDTEVLKHIFQKLLQREQVKRKSSKLFNDIMFILNSLHRSMWQTVHLLLAIIIFKRTKNKHPEQVLKVSCRNQAIKIRTSGWSVSWISCLKVQFDCLSKSLNIMSSISPRSLLVLFTSDPFGCGFFFSYFKTAALLIWSML